MSLRSLVRFSWLFAYFAVATAVVVEVGVRLVPQAIPIRMLLDFEPDLRADIGRRLDLTVGRDMIPVPRDDDGPELWIYPPGREGSLFDLIGRKRG